MPSVCLHDRYVAVQALQAGIVPSVLISGGSGHSTIHLYHSIRDHPVWHHIPTHEGRHEAEVGWFARGPSSSFLPPSSLLGLSHCSFKLDQNC